MGRYLPFLPFFYPLSLLLYLLIPFQVICAWYLSLPYAGTLFEFVSLSYSVTELPSPQILQDNTKPLAISSTLLCFALLRSALPT